MSNEADIKELLESGLKQFDLQALSNPLLQYLELLYKWNSAYNLTAIRDMDGMVSKHILDSLAILPWLHGSNIIDVGTGPGLPGIPLAIAQPHRRFVLLDSNGKKTRFLKEVVRQVGLNHVDVVQFRVENYREPQGFDTVISRAFSTLSQMIDWTKHLIAPEGKWLAMKGRYPETELEQIQQHYTVKPYSVDGLDGERCCVLIDNQGTSCSANKE